MTRLDHAPAEIVTVPPEPVTALNLRKTFLPFSAPWIGEEEIREVEDALRSESITTGPKTHRFEKEFAGRVAAAAALGVNSGTAALHTALVALGVAPGDEVITTPMTLAATVNVVEHCGARPVLVDVEPDTLNIDPQRVAEAVTPRTKAVIPVHFAGHPAELDSLMEIARTHNLAMVEDAAHALPASYRGRPIGSGENPAAFSLHAAVVTGDGGVLTGSQEVVNIARIVSLHGMSRGSWRRYEEGRSWHYDIVYPGFKYNMTDIQASLGLCQLRHLDAFHRRRREVAALYNRAFAGEDALEIPTERTEVMHAWHLYVLRLELGVLRIDRGRFIEELFARNIGSSVHFIPVHLQPFYRRRYGYEPDDLPLANAHFRRCISLPLNPRLSDRDVADVIDAVLDIVRLYRR